MPSASVPRTAQILPTTPMPVMLTGTDSCPPTATGLPRPPKPPLQASAPGVHVLSEILRLVSPYSHSNDMLVLVPLLLVALGRHGSDAGSPGDIVTLAVLVVLRAFVLFLDPGEPIGPLSVASLAVLGLVLFAWSRSLGTAHPKWPILLVTQRASGRQTLASGSRTAVGGRGLSAAHERPSSHRFRARVQPRRPRARSRTGPPIRPPTHDVERRRKRGGLR
jgi:hypothetical protein